MLFQYTPAHMLSCLLITNLHVTKFHVSVSPDLIFCISLNFCTTVPSFIWFFKNKKPINNEGLQYELCKCSMWKLHPVAQFLLKKKLYHSQVTNINPLILKKCKNLHIPPYYAINFSVTYCHTHSTHEFQFPNSPLQDVHNQLQTWSTFFYNAETFN